MAPVEPMKLEQPGQPKKVKVKAAVAHSAFGKDYKEGDEYEVEESAVATLETQGKAHRVSK